MNLNRRDRLSLFSVVSLASVLVASTALAQTAPNLGQAGSFAALAGSQVTNIGSSQLRGDLGVSPGSSITGFPPGLVIAPGTTHLTDAVAAQARADATAAYLNLAGQPATTDMSGIDLGGLTLVAGVYRYTSGTQLTGTLTLNAQGNPNAVFIFQTGTILTAASGSRVQVINGGSVCNVFWQVGDSATINTTSAFVGNIIALNSINMRTGATLAGRALARNAAVTLDSNNITTTGCAAGCPSVDVVPNTLPAGTVGTAFSQSITASGATAPYTFTVTSGALPAGLVLASNGTLSGTPTVAGTFNFTISANDATSCSGSQGYSMLVNPMGGSTGDPHMRTLDGLGYEFQACGEFTLFRSGALEVQSRQLPWSGNLQTSINAGLAMRVGSQTVRISPLVDQCFTIMGQPQGCVKVDGRTVEFSCAPSDLSPDCARSYLLPGLGRIAEHMTPPASAKSADVGCSGSCAPSAAQGCATSYTLELLTGEVVRTCLHGEYLDVRISVSPAARGQTSGLLGNADGDPSNDLQTSTGSLSLTPTREEFYAAFAEFHRVPAAASLFERSDEETPVCGAVTFVLDETTAAGREAFATCRRVGVVDAHLADCAMDVSILGEAAALSFLDLGTPLAVVTLTPALLHTTALPGQLSYPTRGAPEGVLGELDNAAQAEGLPSETASMVGCGGCGAAGGAPSVFLFVMGALSLLALRRSARRTAAQPAR